MISHTPGPWQFQQAPDRDDGAEAGWIFQDGPIVEDEPCVAYVEGVGSVDLALMVAAPELLKALEAYQGWVDASERAAHSIKDGKASHEALDAESEAADEFHRLRDAAIAKARSEP